MKQNDVKQSENQCEVPIFMAQIPFLVAQSALKYIFQGPQITPLPFKTPQMSPVQGGIPFHTYPYPHKQVTFNLIYMYCCLLKCFLHLLIIFSGDPYNSKLIDSSNSSL